MYNAYKLPYVFTCSHHYNSPTKLAYKGIENLIKTTPPKYSP